MSIPAKIKSPTFLLACLVVSFLIVNARWIWLFRHDQLLDIDEAGYFSIALKDYYALRTDGLPGWLQAVGSPSIQAPITTALASLIFAVVGPHLVAGFVITALAGATTIVATYFLAREMMSDAWALAAAAMVASCPIIINNSRTFQFSMPAAATMTLCLLCLVKSDRLSRFGWTSLFGICLGLLPLTRTMTVAFLPGLHLGALLQALSAGTGRVRRLAYLGWAMLLAVATAASWLLVNGTYVFRYLLSFGYGNRAVDFGPSLPFFGLDSWLLTFRYIELQLYVPHTLLVVLGLSATPLLAIGYYRQHGSVALMRGAANSQAFLLLVCIVVGLAALNSSPNKGSAFVAPIVPAMIVLAVWTLARLCSGKSSRRVVRTLTVTTCAVSALPLVDVTWAIAKPVAVQLPLLEYSIVTDGRGPIQKYEADGGFGAPDSSEPLGRSEDLKWMNLNVQTAQTLMRERVPHTPVAFGFGHRVYNTSTVGLQILLVQTFQSNLIALSPLPGGDTEEAYREWLGNGDAANACVLLTLSETGQEYLQVTKSYMEAAARRTGFEPTQSWMTPDNRRVDLWRRHGSPQHCRNEG